MFHSPRILGPLCSLAVLACGVCNAQVTGRTYELLRTDSNFVRASAFAFGASGPGFASDSPLPDNDDTVAHTAAHINYTDDGNAQALGASMAFLSSSFNTSSWSANSSVNIYTSLLADAGTTNGASAEGGGWGVADGEFQVLDFAAPDTTKRAVLVGALYVLSPGGFSGPGKDVSSGLSVNQGAAQFSVWAGNSSLNGDYLGGGTWNVYGSIDRLDLPPVWIDEYWPEGMNRMFLFAHEATPNATYGTGSDLTFGADAGALPNSPTIPATNSGIAWMSLASWFYVEEWDLSATDPYGALYVNEPDEEDFPDGFEHLLPEDNPDIP